MVIILAPIFSTSAAVTPQGGCEWAGADRDRGAEGGGCRTGHSEEDRPARVRAFPNSRCCPSRLALLLEGAVYIWKPYSEKDRSVRVRVKVRFVLLCLFAVGVVLAIDGDLFKLRGMTRILLSW